jgi:hypothetical protein
MNALELAIYFHATYERLAPSFGYETRTETRVFDPNSKNGRLMVAVCEEMLQRLGHAEHVVFTCQHFKPLASHCPECPGEVAGAKS